LKTSLLLVYLAILLTRPVSSQQDRSLVVQIYFDTTSYTYGRDMVVAKVRTYAEYIGPDPPVSVLLSESLVDEQIENATYLLSKSVNYILRFGPWVEKSPGVWTFEDMLKGAVSFSDYSFNIDRSKRWPDDNLVTKIFAAYAMTTMSGKATGKLRSLVETRNLRENIEKSYYYFLESSALDEDIEISFPKIERVVGWRGRLFTLALAHKDYLEGVRWVGWLTSNLVWVLLVVAAVVFTLVYCLKPSRGLGVSISLLLGLLALFANASQQVERYLSPWSGYVRRDLNDAIVGLPIIVFVAIVLALVVQRKTRQTYPSRMKFLDKELRQIYTPLHSILSNAAGRSESHLILRNREIQKGENLLAKDPRSARKFEDA